MAEQTAKLNYLHIAPRKVRLIANTLKGLSVGEAEAQLLLRPQRSAKPLLKLLRSAVQNAKNNQKLNVDSLFISKVMVDQGPILKRSLPRAMGRATPIHKKMSHVTLVLGEQLTPAKNRFIILPTVKKDKKEKGHKHAKHQKPKETASKPEAPKEKKGFLKRIFRRKSV